MNTNEKPALQVEDEIFSRCIHLSHRRVKVYSTWLLRAIRNTTRTMGAGSNAEDAYMLKEFQRLETLTSTPYQLCSHAHALWRHRLVEILSIRHIAHSHRGIWSDIRHDLGRLGSWSKAVRMLILGAVTFPQRIENAKVEIIGTNGPADLPNRLSSTDLSGVVRRMVPADQISLVEQLSQALSEANAVAQVEDRFREEYAQIKPRPHAELLVLEHFHRNGLDFVTDDRYIGCSKPSCYCCHIYMQCHPGRFAPRPCHGNLNTAQPQEHHTFKMLQDMLIYIRRDLQEQILSRRPKRARLPNSTTGMSSVVLDVDALLASARHTSQSHDDHDDNDSNDFGESLAVSSNSEGENAGNDTSEEDTASTEHESSNKLDQMRPHERQHEELEPFTDGDDAGILLFRGRKKHISP
ncbi:hypothetical protein A1O1_00459 [Capronia coronata CBS 617.96]|uniref:Uncharacterized protein n=1 Tax=Capronia coronata CBS 617.96 TaxID=1182541 RepID=W9ZLI6_9EURO|nr:uncharacterized protein A1O1_00459 [Capronia coronata CBS 617.96]EXJ95339.1 hypothetical protein A1O1_00459 [Capronia coronata CBS 617.96]